MTSPYRKLAYVVAMGSEMGALVGGSVMAGFWLDARFHTTPWLALGCLLFGIVAAGWRFYYYLGRLMKDEDKPG